MCQSFSSLSGAFCGVARAHPDQPQRTIESEGDVVVCSIPRPLPYEFSGQDTAVWVIWRQFPVQTQGGDLAPSFPDTKWHGRDMPVFGLTQCFTEHFTWIAVGTDHIADLEIDRDLLSHA
ncbi:MAG: hypothetical protein ACI92Z_003390 [Paracoccaceae bacterium]|jgi:hypothetical protein